MSALEVLIANADGTQQSIDYYSRKIEDGQRVTDSDIAFRQQLIKHLEDIKESIRVLQDKERVTSGSEANAIRTEMKAKGLLTE